ncbi:dihydropteroate synthase [Methanomethylovorans hollandica DSM 15978]|uniref:dihydropteroate synthase n=1 Tax=Methanomethylovorans hollandica (strain DSM 15978 / NBRC 107637 / DMS1) TaxID=867904 RepID=L0KZD9_METHD|nr:dihydropteroate synthase [Methanomethylovorans hollandica]AGB50476.1 dihydropteroate synthase [Methanomethylovorans hollandica DSM 15978]
MFVDADICGLKVGDEHPVRIMGVLNLSQESFYRSSVVNIDSILEKAQAMVDSGATILDIGARSTWLLAKPVISREEELQRLVPALAILKDNVDALISVDTMFADIAEKALELGADMINDVSGFKADERMLDVLVESGCPAVVMATERIPGDPIGMNAIMDSLSGIIRQAHEKGMDTSKLVLDPAIGRWMPEKGPIYDFETMDQFERLKVFQKPLLAAISRKSCIDAVLHRPADERLYGTLAATAIVVHKGAHIIRTHDVPQTMDVVQVAAAMRSRQPVVKENGFEVSVLDIKNPEDAVRSMKEMGVTGTGAQIMKKKSISRVLKISNITTTEALIIKQEILARGGDAALERDAVSHETEGTDILIMGTILQLEKLAKKLECQARDLPVISRIIQDTLQLDDNVEYRYLREL